MQKTLLIHFLFLLVLQLYLLKLLHLKVHLLSFPRPRFSVKYIDSEQETERQKEMDDSEREPGSA